MPSRLFRPLVAELLELRGCLDNPPSPSQAASLTASGLSPHGALSAAGARLEHEAIRATLVLRSGSASLDARAVLSVLPPVADRKSVV